MIAKDRTNAGMAAVDSLVALSISYLVVTASRHSMADLRHPALFEVHFLDAAFGVLFAFAWQYTFTILFLDDKLATLPSRLMAALKGVTLMTVAVTLSLYVFHPAILSPRTILALAASLYTYQVVCMMVGAYVFERLAARDPRRAIILGSGRRATKAWKEIRTRYHSSIKLLGFVDDRAPDEMPPDLATRYLGSVDQLHNLLLEEVVDILLVAMPNKSCYSLIQKAISVAENNGVPVVYLQDTYALSSRSRQMQRGIFTELTPDHDRYLLRRAVKRVVDVVGALLGMVLFSPLILGIALILRLTTKESVFCMDDRYGYRRRLFRVVKFRCMSGNVGASVRFMEAARNAGGPIFNRQNDPRMTALGRFLRKTSLEDLPELWNVLVGDMSLVGPRPMSVRDLSVFAGNTLMRRFSVQPGMTGLWQVNGRAGVTFDEWTHMDSSYIDGWSLALDLRIIMRTFRAVFNRSRAVQS